MADDLTVIGSTSCGVWSGAECNATGCIDLLYLGAILVNAVCHGGISGTVGLALEQLDTFINRKQKAQRAPVLFELDGTVTVGNASIEAIAILVSSTWNVVMLRDGVCSHLPGVIELNCTDSVFTNIELLAAFESRHLEFPRARLRAKRVMDELNQPHKERNNTLIYLVFEGLFFATVLIVLVQCLKF